MVVAIRSSVVRRSPGSDSQTIVVLRTIAFVRQTAVAALVAAAKTDFRHIVNRRSSVDFAVVGIAVVDMIAAGRRSFDYTP